MDSFTTIEAPAETSAIHGGYMIASVSAEQIVVIVISPDLTSATKEWFTPKTDRGRRMLEFRRKAKAAGEPFFPPAQLHEELRKLRE